MQHTNELCYTGLFLTVVLRQSTDLAKGEYSLLFILIIAGTGQHERRQHESRQFGASSKAERCVTNATIVAAGKVEVLIAGRDSALLTQVHIQSPGMRLTGSADGACEPRSPHPTYGRLQVGP